MIAPVIMNSTMQDVLKASLPASKNDCQVSCRRAKPMSKAPPAPIAPDCVGLNQPRKRPPMARKKRIIAGIIPPVARSFFLKLTGAPGGPMAGLKRVEFQITS